MEHTALGHESLQLYIHIPFCVRKCLYCDFLSFPADEETKQDYMEALFAEMAGSASQYAAREITSVFIGGGTPSTVPCCFLERLMELVREKYHLAQTAEVSMEVNPGTVSREMLSRLRKVGINRLSIGLQSADDAVLASLGRIHTWEQFTDTYAAAREAGFSNINVDIMSALPGQTLAGYRETLGCVLALEPPPEHISAYSLIVEEGTSFYESYEKGELELPDEDTDRRMYQDTKELLAENGYHRYEISNYAKAGYECRHNCGYWRRKEYLGFGIGAASMIDNVRFHNTVDWNHYLPDPLGCREEIRVLSVQEQMEEFMFLGLRMTEGVNPVEFRRLFGRDLEKVYRDVIEKNVRDGLLKWVPQLTYGRSRGEQAACPLWLALTDQGLDLSNYVMAQFLL